MEMSYEQRVPYLAVVARMAWRHAFLITCGEIKRIFRLEMNTFERETVGENTIKDYGTHPSSSCGLSKPHRRRRR